mmetsp:Transcript_15650/g.28481  ORF Transcript_15650/g.28481 Transcript_15650/m.28481 type:complete len:554 (+) Transcript_15650:344-2005(+)|eukprot:CAMPEP_0204897998 /NCGR_PEP_ID=MMETSP1397-20131031/1038_1 /ASSEMBLY_ACC=CAM_ASM_000891 /TAXON_ID=49980 /ORGANISM="Climacostomum Climacostomum virens, Strain Stock W-24" /LENGTH=553 /DNA_ID=CAMNT_0052065785 /DNA_START=304 /DNA_END=1965 /DNA_ORIENTATION=-
MAEALELASSLETVEKQEEERLRSLIRQNPNDFDSWLELIKHIETYKSAAANIAAYREFLEAYPQCYGFWRKIADIYSMQGRDAEVILTYEEGLQYLPVCVELWVAYCNWMVSKKSEAEARELFERAVGACGLVFNSNLLWDRYLQFEKNKKRYDLVGQLFWRLLQLPNLKLHDYYTRFKNFIEAKGRKMEHYGASLPVAQPVEGLDTADPFYPTKLEMHYSIQCEEAKQVRLREIASRYERTVKEFNKRKGFELTIKRSFFHAKSLDEEQLSNWRKYLEFEESEGDYTRIVLLYERCLMPCSYYAEFWVRYADYIIRVTGEEAARAIYVRANKEFLSRRPDLFLEQGIFEEGLGHLDEARRLYKHVYEKVAPGLFAGLFQHLSLERREKNFEVVDQLYSEAFNIAETSEEPAILTFVTVHYAKYLSLVHGDYRRSLEIYENALRRVTDRKVLYLSYIEALRCEQNRADKVRQIFERAISETSNLDETEKKEMWVKYLDFMRDTWPDTSVVAKLELEFMSKYPLEVPFLTYHSFRAKRQAAEVQLPVKRPRIA